MTIDEALGPYRGPCPFCGRPDSRHRMWDAVKAHAQPGVSMQAIAWDFDLSLEQVEWIIAQKRFPIIGHKVKSAWHYAAVPAIVNALGGTNGVA